MNHAAANSANVATPGPGPSNTAALSHWQAASVVNALSAAPGQQVQLAVHSDGLGTVQLHATMRDNVLGATLSVDRPEAHTLLSAGLPGLERDLSARQVQVGTLQLQQQAAGNAGSGGGSQTPAEAQAPPSLLRRFDPPAAPATAVLPDLLPPLTGGSLLNLRA